MALRTYDVTPLVADPELSALRYRLLASTNTLSTISCVEK